MWLVVAAKQMHGRWRSRIIRQWSAVATALTPAAARATPAPTAFCTRQISNVCISSMGFSRVSKERWGCMHRLGASAAVRTLKAMGPRVFVVFFCVVFLCKCGILPVRPKTLGFPDPLFLEPPAHRAGALVCPDSSHFVFLACLRCFPGLFCI